MGPAGLATMTTARASVLCRAYGRCLFRSDGCGPPESDADCASLPGCRARGACAASNGTCEPRTAEHCKASAVCEKYGWCDVAEVDTPAPGEAIERMCFVERVDGP
jgi:hypothetical protein